MVRRSDRKIGPQNDRDVIDWAARADEDMAMFRICQMDSDTEEQIDTIFSALEQVLDRYGLELWSHEVERDNDGRRNFLDAHAYYHEWVESATSDVAHFQILITFQDGDWPNNIECQLQRQNRTPGQFTADDHVFHGQEILPMLRKYRDHAPPREEV